VNGNLVTSSSESFVQCAPNRCTPLDLIQLQVVENCMVSKSDLPSFDEYFAPAVAVLQAHGGSATIEELEEGVAAEMKLSDDLRSVLHGEGPRTQFEYELAWVRTYLKKVRAAENSERGVWRLTPLGSSMSEAELALVPQKVRSEDRGKRLEKPTVEATPVEHSDVLSHEASGDTAEQWKEALLECLLKIDPGAFERLCQRILRESGFVKVEVTGKSGDGGIDGIGVLRLNLLSFQVFFQCKRWKGSVGPSTVRDFRGAMVGRADKGLVITTATFTADARREATRDGAPAIDLVDGETLCDLLKSLRIGVSVQQVEHVVIDEKAFAEI
jgi:restriction system protein